MPPRNYSRGTRAALAQLSHGRCYWQPVCTEPLFMKVNGQPKLALQIAHIRTDERNHERFVPNMKPEQVDGFDNLLFLCKPHHDTIDAPGAEKIYTIDLLTKWKTTREAGQYEQLHGLRSVTEDRLVELIAKAQQDRDQEFTRVLTRLENSDQEAAVLLRELREELAQVRRNGRIVDPDAVSLLSSAASRLRGVLDTDAIYSLSSAARRLATLSDTASALQSAAASLKNLPEQTQQIESAARALSRAAANAAETRGRY